MLFWIHVFCCMFLYVSFQFSSSFVLLFSMYVFLVSCFDFNPAWRDAVRGARRGLEYPELLRDMWASHKYHTCCQEWHTSCHILQWHQWHLIKGTRTLLWWSCLSWPRLEAVNGTANLRTKVLDFRGFDSSIILILRAGILMSIAGSFLVINLSSQVINLSREILSREMGRSTACCQSSIWKHGPSPSEIWAFKGHFAVNISTGSEMRDPQFEIFQIEIMRTDRRKTGLYSHGLRQGGSLAKAASSK